MESNSPKTNTSMILYCVLIKKKKQKNPRFSTIILMFESP